MKFNLRTYKPYADCVHDGTYYYIEMRDGHWYWTSEEDDEEFHGPFDNYEDAEADCVKFVADASSSVVTPKDPAPATTVCGNKYARTITDLHDRSKTIIADVYSVVTAYGCTHPIAHAVKKLLCPGTRGHKDYETDLREAIDAINRELSS